MEGWGADSIYIFLDDLECLLGSDERNPGWRRHRGENSEFGYQFFQTGKHRECRCNTGKILTTPLFCLFSSLDMIGKNMRQICQILLISWNSVCQEQCTMAVSGRLRG